MAQSKKVKQTWVLFIVTFLVSLIVITYFIKSMSPDVDVEIGGEDIQNTEEQILDNSANITSGSENTEFEVDDNIEDVKQVVKMQEEEEKHKDDLKNDNYNTDNVLDPNVYDDFPPMPTYIDNDGVSSTSDTSKKVSVEKNNTNIQNSTTKMTPKTVLSTNNLNNTQNNDDNIGFDIKDSIEKLKAQLNSSNEDNQ